MITFAIPLLCLSTLTCPAQYHYLPTKSVDSIDTYIAFTYHDPYRRLEYVKDTFVVSWSHPQPDYLTPY